MWLPRCRRRASTCSRSGSSSRPAAAGPELPDLLAASDFVDLIHALQSGRLGAAGLDVYEDEPHVPIALRESPRTVLLPHIGSATAVTRDAMARLCAEDAIAVIEGREPPTPVA